MCIKLRITILLLWNRILWYSLNLISHSQIKKETAIVWGIQSWQYSSFSIILLLNSMNSVNRIYNEVSMKSMLICHQSLYHGELQQICIHFIDTSLNMQYIKFNKRIMEKLECQHCQLCVQTCEILECMFMYMSTDKLFFTLLDRRFRFISMSSQSVIW